MSSVKLYRKGDGNVFRGITNIRPKHSKIYVERTTEGTRYSTY